MTDEFKRLTELLAQGINFKDNAVVMATLIGSEISCYQKGSVANIAALITAEIKCLYEGIDNEHDRDLIRDYFIEVLNKEAGVE